jgi:hypothetical protein
MTPDKMRQCMSLGYSAKSKMANTIGQCELLNYFKKITLINLMCKQSFPFCFFPFQFSPRWKWVQDKYNEARSRCYRVFTLSREWWTKVSPSICFQLISCLCLLVLIFLLWDVYGDCSSDLGLAQFVCMSSSRIKTNLVVIICLSLTQSIGMLSYTFLRGTGKEDVVVPMVRPDQF